MWVRNQESGIRNQESGIRNQESGIRNQESGIRNQAIRDLAGNRHQGMSWLVPKENGDFKDYED